jgi:transposase
VLFVGDDWAEDHHDVEIQDETGRKLAARRLPEGAAGITRLHKLIAAHLGAEGDPGQVVVAIETDRGLWVQAMVAAGYTVYGLNPKQVARFKERYDTSGAKSDAADAHALADMVRTERHQLREVAADTAGAEAIKVVARAHQTLVWERTRHTLRLRSALREFFPAAQVAYMDLGLTGADTLELLVKAPDPVSAAKLTIAQITAALKRARRHSVPAKAEAVKDALGARQLAQPPAITVAYAVAVQAIAQVLITLNEQIKQLEAQVEAHFHLHPDAPIYLSQPGIGSVNGARVLAEFGDAQDRYASRESPQELRRHQPDHPRLRTQQSRPGPLRPQRPARRRPAFPGPVRTDRITRSPLLLRQATRPRPRPQHRPPPGQQPPRRHPARLPENQHNLQLSNRLAAWRRTHPTRRLTAKPLGCLTRGTNGHEPHRQSATHRP